VYARPAPDVYDDEPWELAAAYRVTLWEQPARSPKIDQPARGPEPLPGAPMGWEEMTFELAGAQDVREVIQWAERRSRRVRVRQAVAAFQYKTANT
jgi:hypothetical protein